MPRQIAELQHRQRFVPGIILEGGAIDGNGRGTVLTTESCLLNPNRNPQLGRQEIESYLARYLGVRHVLWLADAELAGDDTDGHIDQIARFVSPTTVVATWEDDSQDSNFEALQSIHRQLGAMVDQDGRPLTVVRLPLPRPKFFNDQRLPASYSNFYIANGLVVVPAIRRPR